MSRKEYNLKDPMERFFNFIEVSDSGCWLWNGYIGKLGYAFFTVRSTSILIVEKGFERVSHNYEVGGFEITKSIARSLNISLNRAEELKKTFGLKTENDNIIQEAMSSLLDMMALEAKKTIQNYEDLRKTKISKVILVGGLANMPNFINYFSEKIGLPVSLGSTLARVVVPAELGNIQNELNLTFAVSIGLAMREI